MEENQSMNQPTVGIIGYGRFGQFWAEVLSSDYDIIVTDREDLSHHAAQSGVRFASLADLCTEANAIFLCVPINRVEDTVRDLRPCLQPGTTVLDTCSVKTHPAQVMENILGNLADVELIATHPMFGPDSGKDLLEGLPIVMWPLTGKREAYDFWQKAFKKLGLTVVEMPPDEHDRLAANSQGVTHYVGRVLGEMELTGTPIDTSGYKTLLTTIEQTCNDTWELFHDLQRFNPFTHDMRLRLETAMDRVYTQLMPESASPGEMVIGIQGGKGSFNEEACRYYCATNGIERYRMLYLYTAYNVLDALHRGEADRGVFAVQNARGGVVMETIEALCKYRCEIIEKFDIVISHCIMHHPDAKFEEIDRLLSHPQAIAQCKRNLREQYPHLTPETEEGDLIDQALCAQYIAEGKLPRTTAVLAPQVCAELYGLKVEACGLQDLGDANLTTFVWVQRRHYFR
jgi:prephenate dehydrogenase/prephenate dehydratase